MKVELIFIKCEHCGEVNRVDISMPAQGCIKCGKKIIIPQSEKIIKNNKILSTDYTVEDK